MFYILAEFYILVVDPPDIFLANIVYNSEQLLEESIYRVSDLLRYINRYNCISK